MICTIYFFIASVKATKIRSPVIQDHVSDETRTIQRPILKIASKKGSVYFNLAFLTSNFDK